VNRNGEVRENSTEPRLESCSWRRAWNRADPEAIRALTCSRDAVGVRSRASDRDDRLVVVSSVLRRSIGQVDRAGSS